MYKITVLYNHPDDVAAFEKHYEETHLPLARELSGVSRVELTKFVRTPSGQEPEFFRMAEIFFVSENQMSETMGSPEGQMVIDDLHHFATSGVKILVGEVVRY